MADDEDLFDGTDDDEAPAGSGEADEAPAPQSEATDDDRSDSSAEDRVKFWMSKAQKAESDLRKERAQRQDGTPREPARRRSRDEVGEPARASNEFESFMRENTREQIFARDERLKDFGFSIEDVSGDSVDDMQASFKRLASVIDKAESRALNKAFETVGIDPSLAGGPTEKRDYASMSDEEFEKEIQKAKGLSPARL